MRPDKEVRRVTGAVAALVDVSEQKRAEQAQGRYVRMLDSSFDAIIVRDAHDRIRSWNPGATELYGWTTEEALGPCDAFAVPTGGSRKASTKSSPSSKSANGTQGDRRRSSSGPIWKRESLSVDRAVAHSTPSGVRTRAGSSVPRRSNSRLHTQETRAVAS